MKNPKLHPNLQATQAGFTIIESLLALMLVSILMVALSPVIVLSVATRVQARRVELATQAARTYIDGVRAQTILDPPISNLEFKDIAAPKATGTLKCDDNIDYTDYCQTPSGQTVANVDDVEKEVCEDAQCTTTKDEQITVTTLYCVDLDEEKGCSTDSTTDMIVQAVGYHKDESGDPQARYDRYNDTGYELGIRVYRASAFKESGNLEKSVGDKSQHKSQQAGAAAGVFESQLPLLEITTAISPRQPSLSDLRNLLDDS
ncbi:hormogonium polysaccharide secretion pseudopilin HpsB [Coleofasciculus sp. F4-SAH-05]|uniref:hormogonium polysaccharide secretion pseudopilin HpsB n=1 Tax=Coleofasciculus sp. F4-SAH-05 TaxID=3069525 RepID=UPI0032F23808